MGKKWLVIGALALIAILIVMWREADRSEATPVAAPAKQPAAAAPRIASVPPPPVETAKPAEEPAEAAAEPAKPEKYDPQSDEFFYKHDEVVIPNVMRSAVKCWENLDPAKRAKIHRNQSIVIKFKQKIVNGTVTMHDPQVERSSIGDAALESCFIQQVLATTWSDAKLPDWEQEDTVKISPRVLKKYTRENIEYVGPAEPETVRIIRGEELKKDFDPNFKE
jgi:hypothetical protein